MKRVLLRILLIEDSVDDAELLFIQLEKAGLQFQCTRVDNLRQLEYELQRENWDLILSDYNVPGLRALDALALVRAKDPEIPFIVVSGAIGEEVAVQLMKAGAQDYIPKSSMMRLTPAIERELKEAEMRRAKRETDRERVILLRQLEEALRARDEFISIASHELKTPITSIKLQVQMLERTLKQDPSEEAIPIQVARLVDVSNRQLDRLSQLVEDMLDMSSIEGGHLHLNLGPVDVSVMIQDVITRLSAQNALAQSTVRFHPVKGIMGFWDRSRMEQAISNLLANALKYGRERPIEINLKKLGTDAVQISVKDEGIGIREENHRRIFERFERAISATNISGFGLGLYIVKKILNAHGGTIQLESQEDRGSTFHVFVPLGSEVRRPSHEAA